MKDTKEMESKLKNLLGFEIQYFAKKHGKVITRHGIWQDDKCKLEMRDNSLSLTYWDIEKNSYRMANDIKSIVGYFPQELKSKVRQ